MKKKYLIIALTALSFFAGNTNNVQAQDSTLSFGKYLTSTPWVTTYGIDFVDNDGKKNPFDFRLKNALTPFKFAFEKDIYGFRHWNFAKGLSAQVALGSTSLKYRLNSSLDLNLKYDLLRKKKKIDLYILLGGGYSYLANVYVNVSNNKIQKGYDNFLNLNLGGGLNYWIFDNVGINLQSTAKFAIIAGDDHYLVHSAALVFRLGGAKAEEVNPYTHTRSKEAEDALIHLREHLNK